MSLRKTYFGGTHRLVLPEDTLARIEPHLSAIGVTRCADVTGLDRIGVPVFCAVRPQGRTIQVTNGKGLRPVDARVSALMEALEVFHAEQPEQLPMKAALRSMVENGRNAVTPSTLLHYRDDCYFTPDFVIGWVKAEELLTAQEVWLPASAVYCTSPTLHDFSSNGLASGNELTEATLHALYELIERDAISRLCVNGVIRIDPERCACIDLATIRPSSLVDLLQKIERADIKLVLLWVKSCIPVHTFWALLLDKNSFDHSTAVHIGYGTHLSAEVAAVRAVTEAAQARVTYMHGAREDLPEQAYFSGDPQARILRFFDRLEGVADWSTFNDTSKGDLQDDYRYVIESLAMANFRSIFRVELTRAPFHIPVAKVLVPRLEYNERLF